MTRRQAGPTKRAIPRRAAEFADQRRPFSEHIQELRHRLMFVAISVLFWSILAYSVEHQLISILLKPAHDQQFIYTSPGGGINFLLRLCFNIGIALSIPVIVYQVLRYIEPLLKKRSARFILIGSGLSGVLAVIGMAYGYFWGLPAALNFLLHQFVTKQIQPLLTIQSYMSFVTVYMLGSAMLLQIPLVLIFLNRIKPIPPRSLLKYERHVIVAAFIIAGLMNPTPNILALLFIAGPLIGMYQIGIIIVWYANRHLRPRRHRPAIVSMIERDISVQAERLSVANQSQTLQFTPVQSVAAPDTFFASSNNNVDYTPDDISASDHTLETPPTQRLTRTNPRHSVTRRRFV